MIKVNKIDRIRILLEGIGEDYKWNLEGLFWKAEGCKKINDFNTAKNLYETILKENYRYNDALLVLAQCLKEEGKIEIALGYFYELQPIYSKRDCINKCIEELEAQLINYYEYNIDILDIKSKFKLARLYISKNDLSKALDYFNRVSSNSNIIMNKVRILIKMKKYEEALRIINEIMLFESYDDECYFWSAEANFNLKNYAEAIKNNKESSTLYSIRAEVYTKLKMKEEAINDYNYAINMCPEEDSLYIKKAESCKKFQLYDEAIECYEKAIEINYEIDKNYYELGYLYIDTNRYDDAINCFLKFLNFNKDRPEIYGEIYTLQIKIMRYKDAIETLNVAIDNGVGLLELYKKRAEVYEYLGDFNKSFLDYKKVLELYYKKINTASPKWRLYNDIAIIYMKINKFDDAIRLFNKSIEMYSDNATAYRNLGDIYYSNGNYERALGNYQLESTIYNSYHLLLKIAKCYIKLGRRGEGRNILSQIIYFTLKQENLNEEDSEFYNDIGQCYFYLDKNIKAIKYFKKALVGKKCSRCKFSQCYKGYLYLGMVYEKKCNKEKALEYYNIASSINGCKVCSMAIKRIT